MKIRTDFITNSSSASFVVFSYYVSEYQKQKIFEHYKVAGDDAWEIEEYGDRIEGHTIMDNFDMEEYLRSIGVDTAHVVFGD